MPRKKSHGGIHSPLVACYHAVNDYPGGRSVIAHMMEKSAEVLRKKLDHKADSHHLTLNEAMHILRITGDTRILDAICSEAGAVWFFPEMVPEHPGDMDVLDCSAELMNRTMAAINEFRAALDDGVVDGTERARLNKRLMRLLQQINHFDCTAKQFEQEG